MSSYACSSSHGSNLRAILAAVVGFRRGCLEVLRSKWHAEILAAATLVVVPRTPDPARVKSTRSDACPSAGIAT